MARSSQIQHSTVDLATAIEILLTNEVIDKAEARKILTDVGWLVDPDDTDEDEE